MQFFKRVSVLLSLFSTFVYAQESYDNCASALTLCPNDTVVVTNYATSSTKCINCEDDFSKVLCFVAKNTIWLKFTTNDKGGDVYFFADNISYKSNSNQASVVNVSMLEAGFPCDPTTYKLIGNCVANASTSLSITAPNLLPNSTYYVVISGGVTNINTLPAEAQMRVHLSGVGIARPIPSISVFSSKQALCKNEKIRIGSQLTDCKDSTIYSWYINDTLVAKTDSAFIETTRLKQGDVVRVSNTCFSSCKVTINASTLPFSVLTFHIDAGKDTMVHEGQGVQLQGQTNGDTYFWKPDFIGSTNLKPIVYPNNSTTYSIVSTFKGCTLSDEVHVKVLKRKFDAVTSFTPNGDDINDTWLVPYLEDYPNCEVKIFSRWGQPVFETTGYTYKKSWDGRYNGNIVDEGVYFYVIHLRDTTNSEPIQGTITIIR